MLSARLKYVVDGLEVARSVSHDVRNILTNRNTQDQAKNESQDAPITEDPSVQLFEEVPNLEMFLHSIGHQRAAYYLI
ncbi:hypothetical protein MFLAVUS_005153 [Mucor flavus]|uniref:Uncharacterized protein n=1 Tax=Mucor flavus TaxID=439312 RepID=A0ABP9YXZ7_9FUNG